MTAQSNKPREIERYIASRVRKLADPELVQLLEQLRNLSPITSNRRGSEMAPLRALTANTTTEAQL